MMYIKVQWSINRYSHLTVHLASLTRTMSNQYFQGHTSREIMSAEDMKFMPKSSDPYGPQLVQTIKLLIALSSPSCEAFSSFEAYSSCETAMSCETALSCEAAMHFYLEL